MAKIAATLLNASGVGCDTNRSDTRRAHDGHLADLWRTWGSPVAVARLSWQVSRFIGSHPLREDLILALDLLLPILRSR